VKSNSRCPAPKIKAYLTLHRYAIPAIRSHLRFIRHVLKQSDFITRGLAVSQGGIVIFQRPAGAAKGVRRAISLAGVESQGGTGVSSAGSKSLVA